MNNITSGQKENCRPRQRTAVCKEILTDIIPPSHKKVKGDYMKLYIPLCISISAVLLISAVTKPQPQTTPTYTPSMNPLRAEATAPTANQINEPTNVPDNHVGNILQYAQVTTQAPRYTPSPWERKLLAALAEQEDSSSEESMQAVVEVVLNRLESDHYSFTDCKNIEDVIFQAGLCNGEWVEQYQGSSSLASAEPSDAAFAAVDRTCLGEQRLVPDALFHAEASVPSWRIANDIYLVDEIGRTRFWGIWNG
jgi:spore germination cell wall hydrolase CwlJ-like protein